MTAQSSDQSNWNASPGKNASGTNTPRPHVFCSCCRATFQLPAKAAMRLSEPSLAEGGQISVQLLGRALLLARLPRFLSQQMRQLVGVGASLLGRSGILNFSSKRCPRADICVLCCSTDLCVGVSLGSRNDLDNASVG